MSIYNQLGPNFEKRQALGHLYDTEKIRVKSCREMLDSLTDDYAVPVEEDETLCRKIEDIFEESFFLAGEHLRDIETLANALALREVRNGWFTQTFLPSFGLCESMRISAKQAEVFMTFCQAEPAPSGRYTVSYVCRACGNLVKVVTNGRHSYLTIEKMPEI